MTSSDIQLNHEILTLGVIISVMVYAGVAVLALTYIPLLLKTSHTISRRMRNFLLAYVAFMVATSTVNTVTLIIVFTLGRTIFSHAGNEIEDMHAFPNGIAGGLCITLASWAADGFMLWRCAVLYKGISQRYRLAILTLLILLATASFGFCAYFLSDPENGVLIYMITINTIGRSVRKATIDILRSSLSALNLRPLSFSAVYCILFWLLAGSEFPYHFSLCKAWST
ncbi:hypothetical protein BYT27DRAFT_6819373 [Phlegmacium glaucopus]|nr:hypothetical protein BYT27DRAFT_6819373 [Phlegmacium glaucopus]